MAERMQRKLMAHFLDTSMRGTTASWFRLGEDFEEYNVEMNPDTEQRKNILGNNSTGLQCDNSFKFHDIHPFLY